MIGRTAISRGLLPLGLLVATAVPAAATGTHVAPRARLEHELIGIDQMTSLVIEVESSGLASIRFEPDFAVENLQVVGRPSRSEKMSYRNGRVTRLDSLSWKLRPLAVGPAHVKAIRVMVEERTFVLDDLSLRVQEEPVEMRRSGALRSPFEDMEDLWDPAGRRRARPPAVKPKVFLRAEVSPREPFVGQQVLYTLYLFTQADVGAINPEQLPDFNGVWVHEIPQPEQQRAEMTEVGDERYGRVILLRKALFPLRAGRLEFGPVSARMAIKVPDGGVFGPILDRTEEISRTSNKVSLDVKPLPEPPADYDGAVGRLSLSMTVEPAQLEVGQAATLEVALSGEGHIQGLTAPSLPDLDGVRRFPPEQGGRDRVAGTRIKGERSWTYVLVPDRAGQWELPALEYPYFDPVAGEYRVATTQPQVLVARVDESEADATAGPAVPLETSAAAVGGATAASRLMDRPWFFGAVALVPVLLVLALRGVRAGTRRRRETRHLKEHLRAASRQRRPRRAADEIEAAWKDFFAERWGIESPGPCEHWGDLLEERGVETAAAEQMDRLAEDLNYLRFAPELSSTDAVREDLLQRSLRLLRLLG